MRRIIKSIFRSARLTAYLREIYSESKAEGLTGDLPETTVAEATPLACRPSGYNGSRLNLLVPSVALRDLFGGISTALAFFNELAGELPDLRIILTEQQSFVHEDNPNFAGWEIRSLGDQDRPGRCLIPAGDRYGKTLAVGSGDRFMATAWWTAASARAIQEWQAGAYHLAAPLKYLYFIQDYEPGFYAWSSRYAMAEATYHNGERMIAVFNSRELKDFFDTEGYYFPDACLFEPALHPELRRARGNIGAIPKGRRILVYGRPGVERNAFQVIVMALREFVQRNPTTDWDFISAGEQHLPIDLGHGRQLHSLGKLSLADYAKELSRASLGVSLMISPHPSYPPLEMAAFGIHVVTNRYKSKDLSRLTPYLHSVDSVDPGSIATALEEAMQVSAKQDNFQGAVNDAWQGYLQGEHLFAKCVAQARASLNLEQQPGSGSKPVGR